MERISDKNYIPTFQDKIRCHKSNYTDKTRIFCTENYENKTIKIHDVGMVYEKRKWEYSFGQDSPIIFFTSLTEYFTDMVDYFNDSNDTTSQQWFSYYDFTNIKTEFSHKHHILILSKYDVFQKEFQNHDISKYIPEFNGNPLSENDVLEFIIFKQTEGIDIKKLNIFVTNLTDSDEFDILMNDIENIALGNSMKEKVKIIRKKIIFNYEEFMKKFNRFTEINFSFE